MFGGLEQMEEAFGRVRGSDSLERHTVGRCLRFAEVTQDVTGLDGMAALAKRLGTAIGLLYVFMPWVLTAQEVKSKDGNIYFRAKPSSDLFRVTAYGLDRDPHLSPDGEQIVFIRGTPGSTVETPTVVEIEKTELWIIRTDGKDARLLLRGGTRQNSNGVPMADFKSPQFAPNGQSIYFLSMAAVVTDLAYAIDLKSDQLREICGANSLLVVRKGTYAGDLVVTQHRYFIGGGSYDWAWLVDSEGKDIGPLGDPRDDNFDVRLRDIVGEDSRLVTE